jgi:hypothetical protein
LDRFKLPESILTKELIDNTNQIVITKSKLANGGYAKGCSKITQEAIND